MKRLIRFILFGVMVTALSIGLAACSRQVATPIQLFIDDNYVLTWKAVEGARGYTVKVTNTETNQSNNYTSSKVSYSLTALEEGYYDVCVKAVSGDKERDDSNWSLVVSFPRERDTGCVYQLINANREYEIVRYGSASGELVIEDMHRGKPVTSIADKAFKGCTKITSVVIGANVNHIGDYAFMNCTNLRSVTIPDAVNYLGEGAFQQCRNLQSVKLPEGIDTVRNFTFAYCRALTGVEFNENLTSIKDYSFVACSALTEVTLPDSVETVGEYAFSSCDALKTVTFGTNLKETGPNAFSVAINLETINFAEDNHLETIGEECFRNCSSLTSVTIPDGTKTLGTKAFNGCSNLENVRISDTVTKIGEYCFSYTKLYLLQDTEENENGFIYADKWVISVRDELATPEFDEEYNIVTEALMTITLSTFKDGTYGIADRALAQMFSLRTITLNPSIKYIGKYSFASCTRLWNVQTRANGLIEIGELAFYNCKMITSIRLSEGLKTIEKLAFYKCENLESSAFNNEDVIPSTVERIGQNAFLGTAIINQDARTARAVYMGNWVVGCEGKDSVFATNLTLEAGTVGIADYAFNSFTSLLNISGLSKVKYIGKGAFWGCQSLGSISLGSNVRTIEEYTFSRCISLFKVGLPESLRSIGTGAFWGCTTLNEIDLSNTRTETIGERAFYGCTNLKTLNLDASYRGVNTLTEIGERAFYGCISLGTNTEYYEEEEEEESGTKWGGTSTTDEPEEPEEEETEEEKVIPPNTNTVVIPYSVKTIGARAFYGCVGLENLEFTTSVDADGNTVGLEYIGEAAFAKNSLLKAISLPSTVKVIKKNAFYRCYEATTLDLGDSVEYIGDYAFEGSPADRLVLPSTLKEVGKYAFRRMTNLESVSIPASVEVMNTGVFYECKNATLYVENDSVPATWNVRYNPSFRPVIYGAELSEDKTYVAAVTVTEDNVNYVTDKVVVNGPERRGYEFSGWSKTENGTAEYTAAGLPEADKNVKLYSTWSIVTYNVNYVLGEGGAVNAATNPSTYTVETDTITLAAPTWESYAFKGWYLDEGFNVPVTKIDKGSAGEVTLYAKWVSVTITVDVTGIEWFTDDEATAYIYVMYTDGTSNGWPGEQMTDRGDGTYTYVTDGTKDVASVTIIRMSPEGAVLSRTEAISSIPSDNYIVLRDNNGQLDY